MYDTFQKKWIISSEVLISHKLGEHQAVFGAMSEVDHRANKKTLVISFSLFFMEKKEQGIGDVSLPPGSSEGYSSSAL